MSILPFQADDRVLWHGVPARVVECRGDRVALTRLSDSMTIITTSDILRAHQPVKPTGQDWVGAPADGSL